MRSVSLLAQPTVQLRPELSLQAWSCWVRQGRKAGSQMEGAEQLCDPAQVPQWPAPPPSPLGIEGLLSALASEWVGEMPGR